MKSRIVIGSRGSQLALTQTNMIANAIRAAAPGIEVGVEIITTTGDRITDSPLSRIGGKGLFTKELEVALLEDRVDLCVHSLKDLPTELPEGLMLAATPPREMPYDALVCARWGSLDELPGGIRVGTSSLRRAAQLRALRPDLSVVDLRGNVDTRVRRVMEGAVDAAIMASAGLRRMGREQDIRQIIPPEVIVPAPGQGSLGIEARGDDSDVLAILGKLHDEKTAAEVRAERTLLAVLEGGCQVPFGALARAEDGRLTMTACVASVDGSTVLRANAEGRLDDPESLGRRVAEDLLARGAGDLIAAQR